jgi:hypothetical protein
MDLDNTAVVGILPRPRLIAGSLSAADRDGVFAWIERNHDPLVEHWSGFIDGAELGARQVRL